MKVNRSRGNFYSSGPAFHGFRPAQILLIAYLITLLVGTFLLMLPAARTGAPAWPSGSTTTPTPHEFGPRIADGAPFSTALFTSTSASAVTGLITVDTATYWSFFGKCVLVVLMQCGGLGTMTFAVLIGIVVMRKFNLPQRRLASAATGTIDQSEIIGVIKDVVGFAFLLEFVAAAIMFGRLMVLGVQWRESLGHSFFLAVSAYNNAGFAPYTTSLMDFVADPWIILPISVLIIAGGLGAPTWVMLRKYRLNWYRWNLTARLVVAGTCLLIFGGWFVLAGLEWNNPATLGPLDTSGKVLGSLFSAISPRTAGFNSVDIAGQHGITWLMTDVLMFIGGGPAGTAGGIKITTVLVLIYIAVAEVRGNDSVHVMGRRLSKGVYRQALTLVILAVGVVGVATTVIMVETSFGLDQALFESLSAFGTVGLTTGVTSSLPPVSQIILVCLMILGRLGPATVATALAVRKRRIVYDLPKDRPLIG